MRRHIWSIHLLHLYHLALYLYPNKNGAYIRILQILSLIDWG
jgi:hypothetical protein